MLPYYLSKLQNSFFLYFIILKEKLKYGQTLKLKNMSVAMQKTALKFITSSVFFFFTYLTLSFTHSTKSKYNWDKSFVKVMHI